MFVKSGMTNNNWREALRETFIQCGCGNEVLRLCYWVDEGEMFLSMYEQYKPATSIRDKLRWIWRIITKDTPFEDEICLDRAQVEDVIKFCAEYIDLVKKHG
jgi:hypothetical protein